MKRLTDLMDPGVRRNLRKKFLKDGYIFFPGFLNPDEIHQVQQHIKDFIDKKIPQMPEEQVYYEDKNDKTSLKQLQELFKYDKFFKNLMFKSRFEELASILLNDQVIGHNLQYFNKPPQIGNPTPPHQDGYYFMLKPNEAVTMWLALEDVDEGNGCVRYVRGSHKVGLRPHGKSNVLGFSLSIIDYGNEDRKNEVSFEAKAGDLLVHHSLTIHRADGNSSMNRTRKAIGLIYYAEKARQDIKAVEAYKRKLNKELKARKKI